MAVLAARGVELSWSSVGKGDDRALLVHETATDSRAWRPLAESLAGLGMTTISYDRRGWGATGAADDYRRTTIEEQSEDAAVLVESLDAGPVMLCGAGTGAVIALDLLLRRPELVDGAVLIEPPVLALVPAATEVLSADSGALESAAGEGLDALVRLYLSGGVGALGAGATRLPSELTAPARERPVSLLAELGAVPAWGMALQRLGTAERPSLVVTAGSTPSLLRDTANALAETLLGAESRTVGSPELPPHVGAPAEVAALALELAGG